MGCAALVGTLVAQDQRGAAVMKVLYSWATRDPGDWEQCEAVD